VMEVIMLLPALCCFQDIAVSVVRTPAPHTAGDLQVP